MKNITVKFPLASWLLAFLVLTAILGFAPGGDSYRIQVNGKAMVEEYVFGQKAIPAIAIDPNDALELSVSYSHCGAIGTTRLVLLKDGQGAILKQWSFADSKQAMLCQLKEVGTLSQKGNSRVGLYYSSSELPEGRLLAHLQIGRDQKTALKQ